MKIVKQEFKHNPSIGIYGDCYRACVASVLELPISQVPHLNDGLESKNEYWKDKWQEWLNEKGYSYISIVFDKWPLELMGNIAPNVYYLLGGLTIDNIGHTIVCLNDKIVNNPGSSLITTPDNGYYFVDIIIAKGIHYKESNW